MRIPPPGKARRARGFTLAELMVAIFLSILVITALYSVFSRVQEMFRVGHNQTLVLERGRAIMDMMVRDLEMMQAASLPNTENLNARDYGVEFHELDKTYNTGNIVFKENERAYFVAPNLTTRIGNDYYKTYLPPDLLFFDEPPPVLHYEPHLTHGLIPISEWVVVVARAHRALLNILRNLTIFC